MPEKCKAGPTVSEVSCWHRQMSCVKSRTAFLGKGLECTEKAGFCTSERGEIGPPAIAHAVILDKVEWWGCEFPNCGESTDDWLLKDSHQ